MSVDKVVRDIVREEVERIVAPLVAALEDLRSQGELVSRLAAALGQPVKRKAGRPAKLSLGAPAKAGRKASARGEGGDNARPCALQDCKRPARSKGYCAAHYQKYRMLEKTGRLPSDWKPFAEPNSVENLVLPRGRAGAKALAESKKK